MEKNTSRWLMACGIGCAGLIVLAVAIVGGSAYLIHSTTRGFEAATKTRQELEERFGKATDFQPWPDGAIPAARLEAFLAVREGTMAARDEIARSFKELPMGREEAKKMEDLPFWQKMKKTLSVARTGIGLGGSIGELFRRRNESLLHEGMGMGEYSFLYVLAYQSWLKHSPDDGLRDAAGGVRIETHRFETSIRSRILPMMEAQLEAAPPGQWKDRLARELDAMRADESRVPWKDGVPPQLEASLQPFRERLERTYNPITNEFELALNKSSGFGYTVE